MKPRINGGQLANGAMGNARWTGVPLRKVLDNSALRLIGALLAEQNELWQERRYLDMEEFAEWAAARNATVEGKNVVALAG